MNDKGYDFWKRIDAMREAKTLSSICNETGIKYSRVKKNRSENRTPSVEDIYMLARYFGCSMEYLISGDMDTTSPEAYYVMANETARLLVRKMMNNHALLETLVAVATLSDKSNIG